MAFDNLDLPTVIPPLAGDDSPDDVVARNRGALVTQLEPVAQEPPIADPLEKPPAAFEGQSVEFLQIGSVSQASFADGKPEAWVDSSVSSSASSHDSQSSNDSLQNTIDSPEPTPEFSPSPYSDPDPLGAIASDTSPVIAENISPPEQETIDFPSWVSIESLDQYSPGAIAPEPSDIAEDGIWQVKPETGVLESTLAEQGSSSVATSTVATSTVATSTVATSTVATSTVATSTVAPSTVATSTVATSTTEDSSDPDPQFSSSTAAEPEQESQISNSGGGANPDNSEPASDEIFINPQDLSLDFITSKHKLVYSPIWGCWPPMPIIKPDPLPSQSNLVVTGLTSAPSAQSGQTLSLSWTVQNQGLEATQPSYGYGWSDLVYFSLDNIFGNEDDVYLTSVYRDPFSVLEVSGSYTTTQEITLPNDVLGDGYLFVKTDGYSNLSEIDEADNTQAIAFNITAPEDNLVVTDLIAPTTAQAGQTLALTWTVQNQGQEATTSSYWYDEIYFSLDDVLGNEDDVFLTLAYHYQEGVLDPEGSYTTTQDIYLPQNLAGNGYLLVKTDAYNNQVETNESDNTQAIAFNIIAPEDNLVVTDLIAPTTAQAGQTLALTWTVQNQGQEATTSSYWYDEIYFSLDDVLGNEDDIVLTSVYHYQEGIVDPGGSYTTTQDVYLPSDAVGKGYLLVKTDVYNDQLETDESDNTQAIAIDITPPQNNLVVTDLVAPATAQAGQTLALTWTVQNQGQEATTVDSWFDRVYFSTDNNLSPDDQFFYIQPYPYFKTPSLGIGLNDALPNPPILADCCCLPYPWWGNDPYFYDSVLATAYVPDFAQLSLGANESYTITQKIVLPDYVGEGYLFVKTDAWNDQLETNETDNLLSIAITLQDNLTAPIIDPEPSLPPDEPILIDDLDPLLDGGNADGDLSKNDPQTGISEVTDYSPIILGTFLFMAPFNLADEIQPVISSDGAGTSLFATTSNLAL